jgi:hypothetical protein
MPRYYLDLQDNLDLYQDADGREFENDAAARMGAVRLLIDTLSGLSESGTQTRLFVVSARRAGELEPFAAISTRITSLR